MAFWGGLIGLPGRMWSIGRTVERGLELQLETRTAVAELSSRVRLLKDRMTHLEATQSTLVTEAKSAATAAASVVAAGMLSDTITRLTRLELGLHSAPLPPNIPPSLAPPP